MGETSVRHVQPIKQRRGRGSRRIEAFSPKLKRRIQLSSRAAFELWLTLESDPAILTFCERPIAIPSVPLPRIVDFWSGSAQAETYLLLGEAEPNMETKWQLAIPVRFVPVAELAAARTWISNWERMLPVINACWDESLDQLEAAIIRHTHLPKRLLDIERDMAVSDPTPVRASVYRLLHRGALSAPALHTQPLSLLTEFQQAVP